MQLLSARITDYRSVEDSEDLEVEADVTCLIGKNESGKTTMLHALYRLNPVEEVGFDEVIDYPARKTKERKLLPEGRQVPVVHATFRFSMDELESIEQDLAPGAVTSPEFTATIGYRDNAKTFAFSCDETAVVEHLRSRLELSATAAAALSSATSAAELLVALDGLQEPPSSATALAGRLRGWRECSLALHLADEYAGRWMPKFVYFDDYDAMPGKVSLPDLIRRRDVRSLNRGERALLSLLGMAGVTPEEFIGSQQHERLIRELENSGNVISDEMFEYWSQNKELEVELTTLQPEPSAQPPFHEGPILQIRVHNRRHRASAPFDERSRSFVWFFSFLAYLKGLEAQEDTGLILLLDEPGQWLHGRAQQDALRLIEERLAPKHQVLYTTHSPFMVNPEHLHRVRTVINMDHGGSKIQPTEEELIEFLRTLFISRGQTVLLDALIEPSRRVDLLVTGENTWIFEITGVAPQTSQRMSDVVARLKDLGDAYRRSTGRDATLAVASVGTFGPAQLDFLQAHGVVGCDRQWLFQAAQEAGLTHIAAAALLGLPHERAEAPVPSRTREAELIGQLQAMPEGNAHWLRYQRLCLEILDHLFSPPLSRGLWERANEAHVNRRDIVMPNYSTEGFWLYARQVYDAHLLTIDAKNYTGDVSKEQVLQLANYLSPHGVGLLGIIVTRHGGDGSAHYIRREQWTQHHKMIVILNDSDLIQMLTIASEGGRPEDLIRQKIEDFRLSI